MATGPENLLVWTKNQLQKQMSQDVDRLLAGAEEQILHAGVKAISDAEKSAVGKAQDLVNQAATAATAKIARGVGLIFRF